MKSKEKIMNNDIAIEEYFTYHPPRTEQRRQKHELINHKTLELAILIAENVKDEDCKKMGLFALQQCRMFANQGITVDELREKKENA